VSRNNRCPRCSAAKAVSLTLDLERVHRIKYRNLSHLSDSAAQSLDSQRAYPSEHNMVKGQLFSGNENRTLLRDLVQTSGAYDGIVPSVRPFAVEVLLSDPLQCVEGWPCC